MAEPRFKHETRWLDLSAVGNRLTASQGSLGPQARAPFTVDGFDRVSIHARVLPGATWSSGTAAAKGGLITEDLQPLAVPQQITTSARLARGVDVEGDRILDLVVDTAESGVVLLVELYAYSPGT